MLRELNLSNNRITRVVYPVPPNLVLVDFSNNLLGQWPRLFLVGLTGRPVASSCTSPICI